jgi:hypothetical protein
MRIILLSALIVQLSLAACAIPERLLAVPKALTTRAIGTTDLDARQPVIWNMTAIAASGDPPSISFARFSSRRRPSPASFHR